MKYFHCIFSIVLVVICFINIYEAVMNMRKKAIVDIDFWAWVSGVIAVIFIGLFIFFTILKKWEINYLFLIFAIRLMEPLKR